MSCTSHISQAHPFRCVLSYHRLLGHPRQCFHQACLTDQSGEIHSLSVTGPLRSIITLLASLLPTPSGAELSETRPSKQAAIALRLGARWLARGGRTHAHLAGVSFHHHKQGAVPAWLPFNHLTGWSYHRRTAKRAHSPTSEPSRRCGVSSLRSQLRLTD